MIGSQKTGYLRQAIAKGKDDDYIPDRLVQDIDEIGYVGERVIIKSGQERALVTVVEAIQERRRGQTIPMGAAQGEPQSNEVESWIRRAKEQVRTLKLNLEANIEQQITVYHPAWPWLLEWSCQVINRFRILEDGRTGSERIRGKNSHKQVCCFGETVLYLPIKLGGHERPNMDPKFDEGIWLGLTTRTDEDIVGTPNGIVRSRTIKRLPQGQRWDARYLATIRGEPRRPTPGRNSTKIPARPGAVDDDDDNQGPDDDDDQGPDDDDKGSGPGGAAGDSGPSVPPPAESPEDEQPREPEVRADEHSDIENLEAKSTDEDWNKATTIYESQQATQSRNHGTQTNQWVDACWKATVEGVLQKECDGTSTPKPTAADPKRTGSEPAAAEVGSEGASPPEACGYGKSVPPI